jgi:glutaredoxin 3
MDRSGTACSLREKGVWEKTEEKEIAGIHSENCAVPDKAKIEIYGSEYCGYCTAARLLLEKKGIEYDDILISKDEKTLAAIMERGIGRSVPQIFINGQPIGGFDELYALEQSGDLDQLLGV